MTEITIVNHTLPTGNRFIPISNEVDKQRISVYLLGQNIKTLNAARDITLKTMVYDDRFRIHTLTCDWKLLGNETYPKVELPIYAMSFFNPIWTVRVSTLKKQYGAIKRIQGLDIPCNKGTLTLRWDPIKKGIWVYDIPYEGDLVNNKPQVVARGLVAAMRKHIKTLTVLKLIGGNEEIKIDHGVVYMDAGEKGQRLAELFPKLLDESYSDKELASAAYCAGMYDGTFVRGAGYILDMSNELSGDVVLPSYTRALLSYMYGGYTLPDNHMEWFDEE